MKAVLVAGEEAEKVRHKLLSGGALDKTRKLVKKNGFVEIPVKESSAIDGFTLIEQESPEFYFPKKTLRSILGIPEYEEKFLPSRWQILGDIIIVSLRKELENRKAEI